MGLCRASKGYGRLRLCSKLNAFGVIGNYSSIIKSSCYGFLIIPVTLTSLLALFELEI